MKQAMRLSYAFSDFKIILILVQIWNIVIEIFEKVF